MVAGVLDLNWINLKKMVRRRWPVRSSIRPVAVAGLDAAPLDGNGGVAWIP